MWSLRNGGGHFGPFVDIAGYYSDAPRMIEDLSTGEKGQMFLMGALTLDSVKHAIQTLALSRARRSADEGK